MATALAPALPMNPRLQRRAVPAQKSHAKFPGAMLPVAIFLDGIQLFAAVLLFAMIAIPGIGLIFWVLGFLVNILITVCAFMLFSYWLHHIGLGAKLFIGLFIVMVLEIFSSGGVPSWTILVWRAKRAYKALHNKSGKGAAIITA